MKKFFTLIAAAAMVASVNAKDVLDISSLYTSGNTVEFTGGWGWKGITFTTGELIQDQEAKTTDDSQLVYYDASAYDYLCVKYSSSTCDVNVILQTKSAGTIGQWGPDYYQVSAMAPTFANGGFVGVKLDERKNTISQFAFQNQNNPGSITIEEVYWASEAEYLAAKAEADKVEKTSELSGESSGELPAGGYGWIQSFGGASWLAKDVTDFNTLVFEVKSASGKCKAVLQGVDMDGADCGGDLEFEASEEPVVYYYDISNMKTLNQYAFQNLNKGEEEAEADIKATQLEITRVYLTSKTIDEISSGSSDADVVLWEGTMNFDGSWPAVPIDLSTVAAGDKVIVTVSELTEVADWTWGSQVFLKNPSWGDLTGCGAVAVTAPGDVEFSITEENVAEATGTCQVQGMACIITKVVLRKGGDSGISNVVVAPKTLNGTLFNLAGQKVNENYKGVVICNGKKFLNK